MNIRRYPVRIVKMWLQTIHRRGPLLMLFYSLVAVVNSAFAQTWTQTSATWQSWYSVASSADGTKWVAVNEISIFSSTNYGATWTQTSAPSGEWSPVASSADGTKLVAARYTSTSTSIFTSPDSGATWISNNMPGLLHCSISTIASSADGNKLVVAAVMKPGPQFGPIYTSTNAGATWTQANVGNQDWSSVASSADGTKLVAVSETPSGGSVIPPDGQIYTSTNSGVTWAPTTAPSNYWCSVASSADGAKLVAGNVPGAIFTSPDSGTTWTQTSAPWGDWYSVASSTDGTSLIAINGADAPDSLQVFGGNIYTSTNSGLTWTLNNAPIMSWYSVACSADGNTMVAAQIRMDDVAGGFIYAAQIAPAPQLNISPTNGNLMLSWIIPSTNFVLQQSCDLQNWADMTNQPVLNLTNLQNQVILPPPNSNCFYRLASS